MSHEELMLRIEAVLMTADRPIGERKLASILDLAPDDHPGSTEDGADETTEAEGPVIRIRGSIDGLNQFYEETERSFRIERVAGGLQMLTLPSFVEDITRLKGVRNQSKLSQAALETLAIIAYRQPILRADLESIRGVACGEVLRGLMERRLVRIAGRAEELGRPMLYGTTKEFLEIFGLATLDDLPQAKELRPAPAKKPAKRIAEDTGADTDTAAGAETETELVADASHAVDPASEGKPDPTEA